MTAEIKTDTSPHLPRVELSVSSEVWSSIKDQLLELVFKKNITDEDKVHELEKLVLKASNE